MKITHSIIFCIGQQSWTRHGVINNYKFKASEVWRHVYIATDVSEKLAASTLTVWAGYSEHFGACDLVAKSASCLGSCQSGRLFCHM